MSDPTDSVIPLRDTTPAKVPARPAHEQHARTLAGILVHTASALPDRRRRWRLAAMSAVVILGFVGTCLWKPCRTPGEVFTLMLGLAIGGVLVHIRNDLVQVGREGRRRLLALLADGPRTRHQMQEALGWWTGDQPTWDLIEEYICTGLIRPCTPGDDLYEITETGLMTLFSVID